MLEILTKLVTKNFTLYNYGAIWTWYVYLLCYKDLKFWTCNIYV